MQAAIKLLDAAIPVLGKRGSVETRRENFDTLRTHWLESMDARDPPTATTDEQRSDRKAHTRRLRHMRKECEVAVDLGKNAPSHSTGLGTLRWFRFWGANPAGLGWRAVGASAADPSKC